MQFMLLLLFHKICIKYSKSSAMFNKIFALLFLGKSRSAKEERKSSKQA